jgi:hypothetical protein
LWGEAAGGAAVGGGDSRGGGASRLELDAGGTVGVRRMPEPLFSMAFNLRQVEFAPIMQLLSISPS